MKNKINKTLNLILLLSMLNGDILSMQESDVSTGLVKIVQQELRLSDLPNEVIVLIINQIVKPYEGINAIDNIFDFYTQADFKTVKKDLIGVTLTSKSLREAALYLVNRLKGFKEKKYQELVISIKYQYQGLSKDELNNKLRDILNRLVINRDNLEEVAKLILAGANVNERDDYDGNTALIWAAMKGHKDIVQLLIDNGANVNDKDNDGDTTLMVAVMKGHKDIVKLLIDNKANVNQKNDEGYTTLMFAKMKNDKNVDIINLLKSAGAKGCCIIF